MNNLIYNLPEHDDLGSSPSLWLKVAFVLSLGYLTFAFLLVGIPSLSRGAAGFAFLSFLWIVIGLTSGKAKFPKPLYFPLAFFGMLVVSGLFMPEFPIDYIGKLFTVWVGGIAIAVFVANGISISLVLSLFVLVFVANVVAISLGFDTYAINNTDVVNVAVTELDPFTKQEDVARASGIIGHPNLLVSILCTMPFLVFLLKQKIHIAVYLILIISILAVTVLSGSRSGLAFAVLFAGLGAIFLIKGLLARFFLVATGVGSTVLLLLSFSQQTIDALHFSSVGEVVLVQRVISKLDGLDNSDDVRTIMRTEFWPSFYEKPLTGHGPNTFKDQGITELNVYAHNTFAEIAVNWGLVGLLMYYAMYIVIVFGAVSYRTAGLGVLGALAFLLLADRWFVIVVQRPMVLILCLTLVASFPSVLATRRRRRRRGKRHS